MGKLVQGPAERDDAATQDVASVLAAFTFPAVATFTADDQLLAGLPPFMSFPVPDPEPPSRAGVAREVIAAGMSALNMVRSMENSLAACKAALVVRVLGAVALESSATELTTYQTGMAETGCVAEIAAALQIPERTAAGLGAHAQQLGRRAAPRAALEAGSLSWRHVCTVLQELQTLRETPSVMDAELDGFEGELLRLAEGTTASRFAGKARRARESLFPQSLDARTREAFRSRRISNEPGRDGMNWLTLHLPTIAANAIMVHCTRTARAIKVQAVERQRDADAHGTGVDCREYRTLDQLRVDVASILLMGQQTSADIYGSYGAPGGTGAHAGTGAPDGPGAKDDGCPATSSRAAADDGEQPNSSCTTILDDLDDEEPPWAHISTAPQRGQQSRQQSPAGQGPAAHAPSASRESAGTAVADVPLEGLLLGDGSGWVDGVVDGISENPQREFMDQLRLLGKHKILVDPPLPKALILVQVPLLGLLGLTDERGQLDDKTAGPVPAALARKLLAGANTFLRVLTDPLTGQSLPREPDRYKLRDAERSVLQALSGGCYFPNCTNPVLDTELDHVRSFELGGKSTMANLRPACPRHHHPKHFADDKDRLGNPRRWAEPWRTGIKLRGWTPRPQPDGTIVWESPSGNNQPAEYVPAGRPVYPRWLKLRMGSGVRGRQPFYRQTIKAGQGHAADAAAAQWPAIPWPSRPK
ncbi:hypothetical protein ACFUCV_02020 [Specibacter sp. NPDC057265]|uniref:HNH endonuclease signature motif containing protein n=1 Tax=Specibacter sp. NPDC057265 TaxID=3346075 RepID=UPI0036302E18